MTSVFICSVIIPVYNVESTLNRCVDSVLKAMKGYPVEIILVNDGSTDNSLSICKEYNAEFDFIRLIDQENRGLAGARNSGMRIAKGTYLVFLDSDDSFTEDYFEKLIPFFGKGHDLIHFGFNRIENGGVSPGRIPEFGMSDRKEIIQLLTHTCDNKFLMFVWRRAFKRTFLNKNRIQFEEKFTNYGEDSPFMLEVFLNLKEFASVSEALYNYYKTEGSIVMQKYRPNLVEATSLQMEKLLQLYDSSDDIPKEAYQKDQARYALEIKFYNFLGNILENKNLDFTEELKKIRELDLIQFGFENHRISEIKSFKKKISLFLFKYRFFRILKWIYKR